MSPPTAPLSFDDDALVSVAVGAQLIGVSTTTLRSYANAGKVPCVRTPTNQRRFRVRDLRALLSTGGPDGEPSAAAS